MRNTALVLVFAAACGGGGNNSKKDGSVEPLIDAAPTIDAPALIGCTPVNGTTVKTRLVGQVSGSAVLATSPPNDGRLFVLEQAGRIRIFENEQLKPTPYLDISNTVSGGDGASGSEQGLLGLAFPPNFGSTRQFYVFYTTGSGSANTNVVARYTASETDPNVANPTGEVILSIPDFASNHNGGMIEFGPDGFLYIGTGDGGGAGDPNRTAQDTNKLLGKILRIDVNSEANGKKYAIPSDNPFATSGGAPEVFIYGVRNPWRWSFDRATGDMWIGDVGQGAIEELTVLKKGEQAGKNLGWSKYEGNKCYATNYTPCTDGEYNSNGFTGPQYTRTHSENWISIIGGQVYNGSCFPDLKGFYFTTDYGAHPLVRAKLEANGTVAATELTAPTGGWPQSPSSLHADARGELFLTTTAGRIYQIEAGP
ncbi:MAG TPA: PQQ-dependent sugar dehydrogenase [Kofleriaceae bacterium]